ncbi:DUF3786 domain-containing protein [Chloroflexota bacterium]
MLIGEEQNWLDGEEKAWQELLKLDHKVVCHNAKADFDDSSNQYVLPILNTHIFIVPRDRRIWGNSLLADLLLNKLTQYSRLSILWYLIQSKDIPLSGNLINPREIDGGLIFEKGSHMLPLDNLVQQYDNNVEGFIQRAVTLGGEHLNYGNASVRLFSFPRIPVVFVIWGSDEEFLGHTDILFDSTCSQHLPADIIWSIAMMSILVMIETEST